MSSWTGTRSPCPRCTVRPRPEPVFPGALHGDHPTRRVRSGQRDHGHSSAVPGHDRGAGRRVPGRRGHRGGTRVLLNYFPASAATLDDARASSLAAIPDSPAKRTALRRVRWRQRRDGEACRRWLGTPAFFAHLAGPGVWQATPSCPTVGGVGVGSFSNGTTSSRSASEHAGLPRGPPPSLTSQRTEGLHRGHDGRRRDSTDGRRIGPM